MGKYSIHPDFKKYEKIKLPLSPVLLPVINTLMGVGFNTTKPVYGVTAEEKKIPGYHGGTIGLTVFEPRGIKRNAPCLIYFHGGAFMLKASPFHKKLACEYASHSLCKVVFVDYRLAPKYPFSVGVEDCYAALEWVYQNREAIGIDKNKIAIGGDSAGGALAAATSLMARDRHGPDICFQLLIYPVLDARQITHSMKIFTDTPMWNSKLNAKMWALYLKKGIPGCKEYASPAEANALENLPDTYIEVSEFDCLRDEGISFAERLQSAGVRVELVKTKGTIHGFDIAEKSKIVRQVVDRRIAALRKAFSYPDN